MIDPLHNFDWCSLYATYDRQCRAKFDKESPHLAAFGEDRPKTDRQLYYHLQIEFAQYRSDLRHRATTLYEALLYWKLYSQQWVSNIPGLIRGVERPLLRMLDEVPAALERDISKVLSVIDVMDVYPVAGMASRESLAVRSTFLHFLYPLVVPIFDKMVLQALGIADEKTKGDRTHFRKYVVEVWRLAGRYADRIADFDETPVRAIEMALWLTRDRYTRQCPT